MGVVEVECEVIFSSKLAQWWYISARATYHNRDRRCEKKRSLDIESRMVTAGCLRSSHWWWYSGPAQNYLCESECFRDFWSIPLERYTPKKSLWSLSGNAIPSQTLLCLLSWVSNYGESFDRPLFLRLCCASWEGHKLDLRRNFFVLWSTPSECLRLVYVACRGPHKRLSETLPSSRRFPQPRHCSATNNVQSWHLCPKLKASFEDVATALR